jgi:hypothetical protein
VDIDHGDPRSHNATAFDAAGSVIVSVPIPINPFPSGDGNVQTITMNAVGVRRLEITYRDSGGVTDIDLRCNQPTPTSTPTPTPSPTPTLARTLTLTPSPTPSPTSTSTSSPTPTALEVAELPRGGSLPPPQGGGSVLPMLYMMAGATVMVVTAAAAGRWRLSTTPTRIMGTRRGRDADWT